MDPLDCHYEPIRPCSIRPFAAPAPAPTARVDPIAELTALLAMLQAADCLPWPDAAATMEQERRALGLARLAGPEGKRLAAAIMDETERLFFAAEQAQAAGS